MPDEPRRKILCVDDEPDVVDTLFDTLMEDYDVRKATSGAEALKIFDEEDIALVISDQRMPGLVGTELLAEINKRKPICKKILLTGYADINAAVDAINLGNVDRYFSKPWDDEELIKAVEDLLAVYKIDAFFEKVLEDGKRLKHEADTGKKTSELFEKFLDSQLSGLCVVGEQNNIEYLNKTGLEIIKYQHLHEVKGKDIREVFDLNEINQNEFHEKYVKKDQSPDVLGAKLADGSPTQIKANLTFAEGEDGDHQVCGIIFDRS